MVRSGHSLLAAAALCALAARAETVDFAAAADGGTGWTFSEPFKRAAGTGEVYFNKLAQTIASPTYDTPIVKFTLVARCTNLAPTRQLVVCPVMNGEVRRDLAQSAIVSMENAVTEMTWPLSYYVTALVLQMDGSHSTGNWYVISATVERMWSDDPPPYAGDGYDDPARYPPLDPHDLARQTTRDGHVRLSYAPSVPALADDPRLQRYADHHADTEVKDNSGNTQYQGFYRWLADGRVTGFGTYSAAKVTRSFGFAIRNTFNQPIRRVMIDVGYGQWGAHNSMTDTLALAWAYSDSLALVASNAWHAVENGTFAAPFTDADDAARFPCLEPIRRLTIPVRGRRNILLKWTDACPESGRNAALGLWSLTITLETCGGFAIICR